MGIITELSEQNHLLTFAALMNMTCKDELCANPWRSTVLLALEDLDRDESVVFILILCKMIPYVVISSHESTFTSMLEFLHVGFLTLGQHLCYKGDFLSIEWSNLYIFLRKVF